MPFAEAFIVSLSARVSASLIGASARRVKNSLTQPERKKAIEACATAGVTAILASATLEAAEEQILLSDILTRFFENGEIGRELQPLLQAEPLHGDTLLELFDEAGYDAATLPGLDLRRSLEKFEAAFLQAATQQPALQGEIRTRQSLAQTELLREIRDEVRGLGALSSPSLRQAVGLLRESGPPTGALRVAYLNRLLERARLLPLGGIDPRATPGEVGSEVELATVYTALLTQRLEELPRGGEPPALAESGKKRQLSALEVLDRESRLVLLGEPGSGKTTFASFLTLCLAGEALGSPAANLAVLTRPLPPNEEDEEPQHQVLPGPQPWSYGPLLPVHVVLRDLAARGLPPQGQPADDDTLWHFVGASLGETLQDFAPALKDELLGHGGLLLLDGIDEVPDAGERRVQLKRAIEGFAASFPRCRILATGRTYAYQRQDWKLQGFAEAVLAPFAPFQIRHFVERWYDQVERQRGASVHRAKGGAALLVAAIEGNVRLQELARSPLLLTLIAALHSRDEGTLPEKREKLYAEAVDLLLERWERPKVVKVEGKSVVEQPSLTQWLRVDREVMRRELDRLAFEAHRDQPQLQGTAEISEERIIAALMRVARNPEINPAQLVEYLSRRAGLLTARDDGAYAFPHRTFQEYLAACHLTETRYPYEVARLGRTEPQRWREVVLLAGAKAARGSGSTFWSLADALCPETPMGSPLEEAWGARLAGELLDEDRARVEGVEATDRPKLDRIRHRQVGLLRGGELPALERAGAGRVLGRLGDPRPEVTTVKGMELCFVPAGELYWLGRERRSVAYPFWISRFPATQAQLDEFSRAGGYREARYWQEAYAAKAWDRGKVTDQWGGVSVDGPADYGEPFSLPNHPVVGVTWYEAVAFTRWLTERLRAEGLPADWELRLPLEAEWEMAARGGLGVPPTGGARILSLRALASSPAELAGGGLQTVRNPEPKRVYPWGGDPGPELANFDATGIDATSAVGCFPRGLSPCGCEEMSGNVWEWCADVRSANPTDPVAGVALRGGSWNNSAENLAAAIRGRDRARNRNLYIGFRCVLVPFSEHG